MDLKLGAMVKMERRLEATAARSKLTPVLVA
jgi:hypothetical protein